MWAVQIFMHIRTVFLLLLLAKLSVSPQTRRRLLFGLPKEPNRPKGAHERGCATIVVPATR